jgi:citrate synthase
VRVEQKGDFGAKKHIEAIEQAGAIVAEHRTRHSTQSKRLIGSSVSLTGGAFLTYDKGSY